MFEFEVLSHVARLARASWRSVVMIPLACAVTAAGLSFLIPAKYQATVAFIADSKDPMRSLGGLASLAAQFGASVPSSGGSQSPQFYAELVKSHEMMRSALYRRVEDPREGSVADSTPVIEVLEAAGDSPALREDKAIRRLRDAVSVSVGQRTGIVQLTVLTRHATLSAAVAEILVQELNRFNNETRQTQARARREFSWKLHVEALDSLKSVERELELFSMKNRSIVGSASLELNRQRLQRRVGQFQELTSTLRQQYDLARIDEVNDTPVITILDPPTVPVVRASPRRKVAALSGFFLGLVMVAAQLTLGALRAVSPADSPGDRAATRAFT